MPEQNDGIFHYNIYLHFYDCDPKEQAKLSTVLKYAADIAGIDYTLKGYGHQYLWDNGMVFLLSRSSFRIHRMPRAYEEIVVSTWEHGIKGSQFLRDFEYFSKEGELLVSAATAWLLVNPVSRKILRPSAFIGEMKKLPDKKPDCEEAGKLRMPEQHALIGKRKIRYSDLDGNGHVYNAVYGDIVSDFLPEELIQRQIVGFQINYQTEAVLGEELDLFLASDPEDENGWYLEGKNAAGGNCFISRVEFGQGREEVK